MLMNSLIMARSGGFEPPTAWFVARYSIQLSYERVEGAYYIEGAGCCQRYSYENLIKISKRSKNPQNLDLTDPFLHTRYPSTISQFSL